jgi:hypothetical protein
MDFTKAIEIIVEAITGVRDETQEDYALAGPKK